MNPILIKYLGINVAKNEIYKILTTEIADDTKMEMCTIFMDWVNSCHQNAHTIKSNLQIQYHPNQNTNDIMTFFSDLENQFLKVIWIQRRPQIAKAILNRKKCRDITISDFKSYCRVVVIKTAWD